MVTSVSVLSDVEAVLNEIGAPFVVKSWAQGVATYSGADYDEEYLPTGSNTVGSVSISSGVGFVQPLGNSEKSYLEQGLLKEGDIVLFMHGSISVSSNMMVTIMGNTYDVLSQGVLNHSVVGSVAYRKVYLRTNVGSYGVY